ncbi:tyrosine-protein phosphatase [Sphingobacterium pedocola]|nr:CpsB/CapC family capsule biosynthesis tyrosine phosphatase [Sphingobacterium pedocola]
MHSHLLPGLDDGSSSPGESLSMMDALLRLGIDQFYATPHVFKRLYPNDQASIAQAFQELQPSLQGHGVRLACAAEYMVDADFEALLVSAGNPLICLPGSHVLIEMSYLEESLRIEQNIHRLHELGYTPILAHPERYVFYQQSPERIKRFKDLGCLLQLNILSLYGYYGQREQKVAEYLLNKGMIDLVGTDVRQQRHVSALAHYVKKEDVSGYFKHSPLQNEALFSIA